MSRISDLSDKLGTYMLQGWVLTDDRCATPGCPAPLLRSPNGRSPVVQFCAACDGGPNERTRADASSASASASATHIPPIHARPSTPSEDATGSPSLRSSTPPTEVSSTLSSPTFALPVDTEESLRRRQQSDAASAEIGKRLLKGWAMLADECPNPRCFGVPLVRPPKSSMDGPIKKECVACGIVYVEDPDTRTWNPVASSTPQPAPSQGHRATTQPETPSGSKGKGKEFHGAVPPSQLRSMLPPLVTTNNAAPPLVSAETHNNLSTDYSHVTQSLERALHSLSHRLDTLAKEPSHINPIAVGEVADAIAKVGSALHQVRHL